MIIYTDTRTSVFDAITCQIIFGSLCFLVVSLMFLFGFYWFVAECVACDSALV